MEANDRIHASSVGAALKGMLMGIMERRLAAGDDHRARYVAAAQQLRRLLDVDPGGLREFCLLLTEALGGDGQASQPTRAEPILAEDVQRELRRRNYNMTIGKISQAMHERADELALIGRNTAKAIAEYLIERCPGRDRNGRISLRYMDKRREQRGQQDNESEKAGLQ